MSVKKGLCVYCGNKVPSDAQFCPHCGEPTDTSSEYDEEISSGETFVGEEKETSKSEEITPVPTISREPSGHGTREIYKGTIRGLVAGESTLSFTLKGNFVNPSEVYFVMKLEDRFGIAGIPDEILVQTLNFGYFGMGDKVVLQGKILETVLKKWERPMYTILARDFYNESLQVGVEGLMGKKQKIYEGTIRGLVTKGSIISVAGGGISRFFATYFAINLKENSGIAGIPDEILVRYNKKGHFRIGDKVILQGRIVKGDIRSWSRPMYLIEANHFYNESLQFGDLGFKY
ncbi:MAG: zinc ribbon domain-containing protein [Candidatus Freyarchaeum deiterrae]